MKYPLLIILISFLTLNAYSQTTHYVSADNGLYARVAPDRGSKAIVKLNYGTPVELLENTKLKLDVMDGKDVISGEWVKVKAYVSYTDVEAYVFNGFLSAEKLEPRSIIEFEPFDIEIHNLQLRPTEKNYSGIIKDSAYYYVDLGNSPESKFVRIKPNQHYKKIEVYQAVETSITVSDEGPHCDLVNWKHHKSAWIPMEQMSKTGFQSRKADTSDMTSFPLVTSEEVMSAIETHCGERWTKVATDGQKNGGTGYSVGVSTIYFKVVLTDIDNNRIERILAIEMPMGC